jgi:hypothetical protein
MLSQLFGFCNVLVKSVAEINRREVVIVSDQESGKVIWQGKSEDKMDAAAVLQEVEQFFLQ